MPALGLLYYLPLLRLEAFRLVLLVAGYSNLTRAKVLDQRVRDQLLLQIRHDPGVNVSELARRLEVGWGTVVYHLSVLEREHLVSSVIDGRHKRWFPRQDLPAGERGRLAVLANERTRLLYETVREQPGLAAGVLAERAGIRQNAATWHYKRLQGVGLIERVRRGARVLVFPT